MTVQTDVLAGTLVESGYITKQRVRVKGISVKAKDTLGAVNIFSTVLAPVAATYARTSTTVTVTKVGHGLNTGDQIGLAFDIGTGGTATSGNYTITRLTADTFAVTDINSGTINAGAVCNYADQWIVNFRFAAGDTYSNYWLIPGQGILARQGVFLQITNLSAVSVFYG